MLKTLHWLMGTAGLITFVLQGQYLVHVVGPLAELADGPRMLYRSAHIYLLFASLLNLALAQYGALPRDGWRRAVTRLAAFVVIVSPLPLLAGFVLEPGMVGLVRPFTRPALYALFGAGALWSVSACPWLPARSRQAL